MMCVSFTDKCWHSSCEVREEGDLSCVYRDRAIYTACKQGLEEQHTGRVTAFPHSEPVNAAHFERGKITLIC